MATEQLRRTTEKSTCPGKISFANPFRMVSRRGDGPHRVGFEDEVLRKNRKSFDCLLRRSGTIMGKNLSLNTEGMVYFSYGKFVVVIEVPADGSGHFFIYTVVCRLSPTDNVPLVYKRAMQLNFMEFGTRGSTLGLQEDEITLCYSCPIAGMTAPKLESVVEAFVQSAVDSNEQLDAAKIVRIQSR